MAKTKRRGRPKGPDRRTGQKKVTLWLSAEGAKRLKACASYRGEELGAVVERGLDAALAGFYVAHRAPRVASGTEGEISAVA
jgi:hypothetical protein